MRAKDPELETALRNNQIKQSEQLDCLIPTDFCIQSPTLQVQMEQSSHYKYSRKLKKRLCKGQLFILSISFFQSSFSLYLTPSRRFKTSFSSKPVQLLVSSMKHYFYNPRLGKLNSSHAYNSLYFFL